MTEVDPKADPDSPSTNPAHVIEHAAIAIEHRVEAARQGALEITPLVSVARRLPWWGHVRRFWPFLLIAIVALAFIASGAWRQLRLDALAQNFQALQSWSSAHPLLARLSLVLMIAGIIAIGMPGAVVLVVAGGMFFGSLPAAAYSLLGDGLGASLLFLAARRAMDDGDGSPSSALVARLRQGYAEHPISYALFLRLVPVFPFGAVSVALTWLGASYRLFIATSMLGILPSLLVYAALGAGLADAIAHHESIGTAALGQPKFLLPLIALGLLSLVPVLFGLRRTPRVPR